MTKSESLTRLKANHESSMADGGKGEGEEGQAEGREGGGYGEGCSYSLHSWLSLFFDLLEDSIDVLAINGLKRRLFVILSLTVLHLNIF